MQMPVPGEAHRKLEKMVGSWIGQERVHPSPHDPQGGSAIGRVHNRVALDGFIVVQDYEQERNGSINFQGHGVFRWDATAECYVLHWFDSMGMPPNVFRGNIEGDVLSMTSHEPQMHSRAVFDFSGKDAYRFRMEMSPDGNQWFTFMEGHYTRVGV